MLPLKFKGAHFQNVSLISFFYLITVSKFWSHFLNTLYNQSKIFYLSNSATTFLTAPV